MAEEAGVGCIKYANLNDTSAPYLLRHYAKRFDGFHLRNKCGGVVLVESITWVID